MNPQYAEFLAAYRVIARLAEVGALLSWDQETCMPPNAVSDRAEQGSTIATEIHAKITDPAFAGLVNGLLQDASLSDEERVNVREAKRDIDKAINVPVSLVERLSQAATFAHEAWKKARAAGDFSLFKDHLQLLIDLKKEEAVCMGHGNRPYACFLDDHEPGCTEAELDRLFTPLRERLPPLIREITRVKRRLRKGFYSHDFSEAAQKGLCEYISDEMGVPRDRSRLDTAVHPFSTSFGQNDVRRTVRYKTNNPFESLYSAMHENGHALYDLNIAPALAQTPAGSAISLGIHESQSRFWENIVGRSRAFFEAYLPDMRRFFKKQLNGLGPADLYALANEVKVSYIRTEADEVTYNMHVILRYDIERALFDGSLALKDAPAEWNRLFEQYLSLKVDRISNGILQDVHWSGASFGYFPTYALGTMAAAQLAAACDKACGGLDTVIREKRLAAIREWLTGNVHRFGRLKTAAQVLRDATGDSLNPEAFFSYIEKKYAGLYGL
ncbi:MAG: hypothetical protein A2350_12985 [Candidatus Raymondbacteria bacterium RifOxyB12_full_50_8]|uniref:Metal-dependent carboxypeptidase n=1 Tax=Candidatus Raymondbacteria bacterium RIFOXYD12_FULL_49_13 TaxID=1817890 RepID=A0A1F7F0H6_UNCRA|nr:MAG: hypothetical protein A2248_21750 [Candidatus Raymondbacteria bacterium RIFOXYA2_FULL_49_16]OGK00063.1 MAG: hypothetical protein A2519_22305 [Candidatus Raymondbacteria bacterium RIFOXYD12_FULL_49_13]OGK03680.1 MAG: hypothetical protein A2350_12985 [Candidatus Raymondbacteria bacterium RifOxyB12_full_50_8]OGP45052.1 MAG: hypothetical protein A2324_13630 [Candidatus Raymondbacteria bacterium RIFOXYB2_FULL_49_35]